MVEMYAHGFRTALEVLLEPNPNEACPYFGGYLEVWLITPIEVGICIATGEPCHVGKTWAQKVCAFDRPCPFKDPVPTFKHPKDVTLFG